MQQDATMWLKQEATMWLGQAERCNNVATMQQEGQVESNMFKAGRLGCESNNVVKTGKLVCEMKQRC